MGYMPWACPWSRPHNEFLNCINRFCPVESEILEGQREIYMNLPPGIPLCIQLCVCITVLMCLRSKLVVTFRVCCNIQFFSFTKTNQPCVASNRYRSHSMGEAGSTPFPVPFSNLKTTSSIIPPKLQNMSRFISQIAVLGWGGISWKRLLVWFIGTLWIKELLMCCSLKPICSPWTTKEKNELLSGDTKFLWRTFSKGEGRGGKGVKQRGGKEVTGGQGPKRQG